VKNFPLKNANQAGQKAFQTATANNGQLPGNSFITTARGQKRFPGRKSVGVEPTQKSTQAPELANRINAQELSKARIQGYRNRIQNLASQANDQQVVEEYEQILKEARAYQDSLAEETMRNDMEVFERDKKLLQNGMMR
tara:strand:- start:1119 stop:1535 length:417 start_codon:yes stop_codon:yes gene_type:complete